MNGKPKVSVIVPVYNVENYLRECLESIVNQTLKDIEIICIDDGSTDSSLSILNEYAQKDNRIIVINQENFGVGSARNSGMKYARGKYLSFLDSEYFFNKDALMKAVDKAENTNAQIVLYKIQHYNEKNDNYIDCPWTISTEHLPKGDTFSSEDIQHNFFYTISAYVCDKLFETEYIKRNRIYFQKQPVLNTAFFAYTASLKAECIAFIDEGLCFHQKTAEVDFTTDKRNYDTECAYKLLKDIKEFLQANNFSEKYSQDFIDYAIHLFLEDLKGKSGKNLQKEISSLRTKWMKELELINPEECCYDKKKYQELYNVIYDNYNVLDLRFDQGIDNIIIPVVFTTDYNYLKYTIVSMCSILEQPTINITYRFIILKPKGNTAAYKELVDNSLYIYNNYTLEIYEMGEEFEGAYLNLRDLPTSAYFRLVLPELLKECDKCIYIDGDTVVLDDLFNLYSIELADNYIAAVEALVYYEKKEYHMNRLNIKPKDKFRYYNAGVLVMNLKKLREDNLVDKFMSLISHEFESQDQDIINVVCADRIVSISAGYNVMTKYSEWDDSRFLGIFSESEYDDYKKQISKPVIIHYADRVKPWNDFSFKYANHWWAIVLETPCWNMFAAEKTDLLLKFMCDFDKIKSIQKIEKEKKVLERELQKNRNEVQRIKKDMESLLNSASFKTGRIVTFIPRKIHGGIKCVRDNGIIYTIKHIFGKI